MHLKNYCGCSQPRFWFALFWLLLLGSKARSARPEKLTQWINLGTGCTLSLVFLINFSRLVQAQPVLPSPQDLIPPTAPAPLPDAPPAPDPETSPGIDLPDPQTAPPSQTPGDQNLSPDSVPDTIIVKRFEVVGSTVFTAAEFDRLTQDLTNRRITFAELLQAQRRVTDLYVKRGYITSGALIQPQTLQDGVVKIQVVEGELEAINVTTTGRLNPDYVRSRLGIATQTPLNRDRLLMALRLLQLDPLIQNISAELSTGTRPGSNRLDVKVVAASTFSPIVFLDNNRSPSVGSFRRGAQISEGNVSGIGDRLFLSYANTDGSNAIEGSYTLPVSPFNTTLGFNFSTFDSTVIDPSAFRPIDIRSSSRLYDFTLRHPLRQTPSQELAIGLTFSRQESGTTILGRAIPLSPGADAQGQTKISTLRFFQEWVDRGQNSVFVARSQFSLGLGMFNATTHGVAPDSRFFAWRGQLQWVRLLAPDTVLVLRSGLQLADRALLPQEQISLGGQFTVRGYRQDFLLTDNGLLASAELRWPLVRQPDGLGIIQLVPFFDYGTGWNNSAGRLSTTTTSLATIGLGLRWQQGDRLFARLDWGIPLTPLPADRNTLQENGLYLSISYRF